MSARATRLTLAALLAGCAVLFVVGIGWGLPDHHGWAVDELHPESLPRALSPATPEGWHARYPPLHFAVLYLIGWPLRALGGSEGFAATVRLIYLGRAVSVVMSLGTIYHVYRVGRELYDRRSALAAAASAASIAPLAYYAKIGNLDAPYLFWIALSLLFYLRLLRRHRLGDYVLFALAAAAAVCTKDQAYALYALAPVAVVASLYRRDYRRRGLVAGLGRTLIDRRLLAAVAAAVAGFAVFQNLLLNPGRFLVHVRLLLGPMSQPWQEYPATLAGQWAVLRAFAGQLGYALGPVISGLAAAGVAWTLWRAAQGLRGRAVAATDRRLAALLLLAVSYYLALIATILFTFDRYVLPVTLILAFFAGRVLGALAAPGRLAKARRALVAVALAYSFLYAASVDARMLADSRYRVEAWVRDSVSPPRAAVGLGRRKHLPRLRKVPWPRAIRSDGRALVRAGAEVVVVNVTDLRGPREQAFFRRLESGELGYRPLYRFRDRPAFDLLLLGGVGSSQRFVNPELAVFVRTGSPLAPPAFAAPAAAPGAAAAAGKPAPAPL